MDDPKHLIDQAETDPTPSGSLVRARSAVPAEQDVANDDNFLRETPTLADLPQLPREFRLVSIERLALPDHRYQMTAVIFHERASLRVTWGVRQPDTRMKPGMLVEVRWTGGVPRSVMGAVVISRLVLIERSRKIDLFKTVPSTWVKDKTLCRRASMLWRQLSAPCQELISAIFWEGERFARFCAGPSSCRGHHREWGGNFRHAVETAEAALALLPQFPNAHASLAITAALLHDAGKSEDYIYEDGYGNRLSDWGRLVSHRPTLTFWVGEVHRQLKHRLPDGMLQSLLHALNATRAPAHYGLRDPVTPEAILLSLADRASGVGDLVAKTAGAKGNWGTKHSHLNGNAPYTI